VLPALLAIFTSGWLGTAESIALVYAFQNCLGVVYDGLAALVGLFMLGLAAGSLGLAHLLDGRRISDRRALIWTEAGNLVLAMLLGAAIAFAARLGTTGAVLVIAVALALGGAGVGAAFTAAAAVLRDRVAMAAGLVDAADCLGAAVGALATGIVALPLFGIPGTALLLGALKVASLLVVATDRAIGAAARSPE
jgi:MFS family permease